MDRRTLLIGTAALPLGALLPGCASLAAAPSPASVPAADRAPAAHPFPDALMAALAPAPADVVFSPWSIATALVMAREGARGQTAAEFDAVLGERPPGLGALTATPGSGDALNAGNSLWGQRGLAWRPEFLRRLADVYSAPLHQVGFSSDPEAARVEINAWVEEQTRGRIPELIQPGVIGAFTRLVLVNAIHVKAAWERALDDAGTRPFATPERTVPVPMLSHGGLQPWLEEDGWRGTALYCKDRQLALVLVLPAEPDERDPVPERLFGRVLDAEPTPIQLTLPRWKLRFAAELAKVLEQLGIRLAFDPRAADFSGMTAAEQLFIGFVVHQATFEVNAHGIEAAAATAVGMRVVSGAVVPDRQLVLDRPFSYALVHVPTRTCLFLGRVADPTRTQARA